MWISHLIFSLNTGGTENMLIDIINEQSKRVKVLLIIINKDYDYLLLAAISKRVKVVLINRKPASKSVVDFLRVNALFFYYNPVVIHCHNQKLIAFLLSNFKKKAVFTAHTTGLDQSLLCKYKKCYAISKGVMFDILNKGDVKVKVIYNGVNAELVIPKPHYMADKKTGIFKIVQIGRLNHIQKGQDILLHALKELIELGVNTIQVVFVGDGSSRLYLETMVEDLNLTKYVQFLGALDRNEIYTKLCGYDLLVQPSRQEGFGLSIVEGMLARLPVLIADLAGPFEVIDQGRYGFYFKSGDVADLRLKIMKIMEGYPSEDMKMKIDAAQVYSQQQFSIINTANNYLLEYNSL